MKSTFALIAFLAFAALGLQAQNANNSGPGMGGINANANTSGPGNPGQGWGQQYGWPKYVIDWLEQGGDIPHPLCLNVLWHSKEWAQQNFGLNYGQLVAKYNQGLVTIEFLSTSPPSLSFRVAYDGGTWVIDLIDDF